MKKCVNGKYVEISEEELEQIRKRNAEYEDDGEENHTEFGRIEAQVMYTARMTDTVLPTDEPEVN